MARFIMGSRNRQHIGQSELSSLGRLNIDDRVKQPSPNITHGIYYGYGPAHLMPMFKKISSQHLYNTRRKNCDFCISSTKSDKTFITMQ